MTVILGTCVHDTSRTIERPYPIVTNNFTTNLSKNEGELCLTGGQLVNPLGKEVWKTFNAHIDKDGNINGQFQNQGGNSGTWHADVTDLTVVDNTAIIEYHVTFAPDNPSILGQTQCVIVIDNGEGKNAVPDQISQSYLADESGCDDPPSRPMMDLIDGNIQVH